MPIVVCFEELWSARRIRSELYLPLICGAIALTLGCTADHPRPEYNESPKGPMARIIMPLAAPQADKERIPLVRIAKPINMSNVLSVNGEVEHVSDKMLQMPVLVEIRGRQPDGRDVIFDSGFATLKRGDTDRATFRFDIRAPQRPGEYEVEARLLEKWIGRAAIQVLPERR